jgi:multiple sugar transport system substrate-binding protein
MKKLFCFALCAVMAFGVLAGCNIEESEILGPGNDPTVSFVCQICGQDPCICEIEPQDEICPDCGENPCVCRFIPQIDPTKDYMIEFYGWGEAEEIANYREIINDFEAEYPNVFVNYNNDNASTYPVNLRNRANNLPDVFYVPDTEFMYWGASGKLLGINDVISKKEKDQLWPEALDKYYYNRDTGLAGKDNGGILFGLPKDLGPFPLVYNKTLLNSIKSARGLTDNDMALLNPNVPMSWEQFRYLLNKIDTGSNNPFGISHYELDSAVYSNNADFFTEDQSAQRITEQNFYDAVQFIADLHLVDDVMPSPSQQASTNGYQRFLNQNAVFCFMGPWDLSSFWASTNSFEFDILPVPYGPGADRAYGTADDGVSTSWLGSMSYSISADTYKNNPDAAVASIVFAKYLCYNAAAQRKFYSLGQQVPNIQSMAKDEYINNSQGILTGSKANPASRSVFVDIISNEKPQVRGKARARYYTYESSWYTSFTESLIDVWDGSRTAQDFMNRYSGTLQASLTAMINAYRS